MQVLTCMPAPSRPLTPPARQRLLDAAARVFAMQGLEGATTREIARQAKVNEVTLFRHFHSKEKLLGAVLQRAFDQPDAPALPAPTEKPALRRRPPRPALRSSLHALARRYELLLQRNFLLIRTLLGEIHRYRKHEAQVLHNIFAPLKAELIATIQDARDEGAVRRGVDPVIAADLFSSLIFTGVLRGSKPFQPDYSPEQYRAAAVDTFVRGIEPR